jgi:hypothetical protein
MKVKEGVLLRFFLNDCLTMSLYKNISLSMIKHLKKPGKNLKRAVLSGAKEP